MAPTAAATDTRTASENPCAGTGFARLVEAGGNSMTLDLTAQFAPIAWSLVVLMVFSGVSLLMSHR